jgi:hypothetical protein
VTRPTERSAAWKAGFRAGQKRAAAACEAHAKVSDTAARVVAVDHDAGAITIGSTADNLASRTARNLATAIRKLHP